MESFQNQAATDEETQDDVLSSMNVLEASFLKEFFSLNIEVGSELRSRTGTLRRVVQIICSNNERSEQPPVSIQTEILQGNPDAKKSFTIRETVLGARKSLFSVVHPPVRWSDQAK